ncbi:MAG TPA: hypothetical protein VLA21_07350 [Candidatus Limnocylindria bacterium]|nr:hypothetical protein [Candidatus Limnocylindria bacterium]
MKRLLAIAACAAFLSCLFPGVPAAGTARAETGDHAWGPWTYDGDGTHTRVCADDETHTETAACDYADAVTPPDCEASGYTTHTCALCGHSYTDSLTAPTGHDWCMWIGDGTGKHTRYCDKNATVHSETADCVYVDTVAVEPNCNFEGVLERRCSVCEDMVLEPVGLAPNAHSWSEWRPAAAGEHYRFCYNYRNGHDEYGMCSRSYVDVTTLPACTEPGYTTHTCAVCGRVVTDTPVAALGHQPGTWAVVLEPGRGREGRRELPCLRCGAVLDTQPIRALAALRYGNTACALGPRFRDENPELTDRWYMYAPVDLRGGGMPGIPLIAANQHRIGTVDLALGGDGTLTVTVKLNSAKTVVRSEFLAFFQGLEEVTSVLPEDLQAQSLPLDTPLNAADLLGEDMQGLMYLLLTIDYDPLADGITPL